MKQSILSLILLSIFAACTPEQAVKIEVTNPSDLTRVDEIVEIGWDLIAEKGNFTEAGLIVTDESGQQVARQILYAGGTTPLSVIFPASLEGNSSKVYTIKKGTPETFPVKTFGRAVPERKDDFAWENDRVVYRVYGPALAEANENPSNGYDLWLKKTDQLIIDRFYEDDLAGKRSYHVDHGEGLDCYKVAHTLGAGAIAPFVDGKIWVQNNYTTARVLDSGALRTSFELTYESLDAGDKKLSEKVIISLDAASQFNKAVVEYSGDFDRLDLAAGIILHQVPGDLTVDPDKNYISYSENVVSDAGVPAGRSHIGLVFTSQAQSVYQDTEHVAGIVFQKRGEPLTYYFGSGWSQWGFETDQDWEAEVRRQIARISAPLSVKTVE